MRKTTSGQPIREYYNPNNDASYVAKFIDILQMDKLVYGNYVVEWASKKPVNWREVLQ